MKEASPAGKVNHTQIGQCPFYTVAEVKNLQEFPWKGTGLLLCPKFPT